MNSISAARRARNLSLGEISRATRLSLRYVEAIDEDRFGDLPAGLYARAYVRMVATMVGVEGAGLDDLLSSLTPPPDPLPLLEQNHTARAGKRLRWIAPGAHVAAGVDAVLLLALNGAVVALAAAACSASPRAIVTTTPFPLFVLCATTWLVYFVLLAGVHGCTAGQLVCGLSVPRDEAPLTLSAIIHRTLENGPGIYSKRWYSARWSRSYAP